MRFHLLLGLFGLTGIASLMSLPFEQIPGLQSDVPPWALRSLGLINPMILTVLALLIGGGLAHRVSLDAPIVRKVSEGRGAGSDWRRALPAGLLAALPIGVMLFAAGESLTRQATGAIPQTPALVRVLYGGVTEEIVARWGCMTFVVWAAWRIARRRGPAIATDYYAGMLVSSLAFAAAHLLIVYASISSPTLAIIALVMGVNTAAGVVFGWLFWRRGLEAAMIAHIGAHVVALGMSLLS